MLLAPRIGFLRHFRTTYTAIDGQSYSKTFDQIDASAMEWLSGWVMREMHRIKHYVFREKIQFRSTL